jgi:hypothetical protein
MPDKTTFRSSRNEIITTLLGVTELLHQKKRDVRGNLQVENIVKDARECQESCIKRVERMQKKYI